MHSLPPQPLPFSLVNTQLTRKCILLVPVVSTPGRLQHFHPLPWSLSPPPRPVGQCTRTACYAGRPALGVRSDRYRQDAPDAAGSGSSHLNRLRPVPSPAAPLGHTNRKGQGASCAHGTRACTRTPSLQGVARSFRDGMVTRRSRMFLESASVATTSWGRLLGFVIRVL